MEPAKWNVYLINRGEIPLLYVPDLTEREALVYCIHGANKAFDGSDADGFVMIRSDFPMPAVWPGER